VGRGGYQGKKKQPIGGESQVGGFLLRHEGEVRTGKEGGRQWTGLHSETLWRGARLGSPLPWDVRSKKTRPGTREVTCEHAHYKGGEGGTDEDVQGGKGSMSKG